MFGGLSRAVAVWRAAKAAEKKQTFVKRTGAELEFLPAAVEILDTPVSPVGRTVALLLCSLFLIAIIWAWFGFIDTVAVAQGKIIPSGQVKLIQPLEKGLVRSIHVRDGQHVEVGEILIELDPTETEVDKDQIIRDRMAALVDLARLKATLDKLEGQEVDMTLPIAVRTAAPDLVELHTQRMNSELNAFRAQIAALRGEEDRLIAEKHATAAEITKLKALIPISGERERALGGLVKKGFAAKPQWLEIRQQLIGLKQDLIIQKEKFIEADVAIAAAIKKREQATADFRREMFTAMVEAKDKADQAALSLRKAITRESRNHITAPVGGTVQQLKVHTIGGVVSPADPLMVIVPDDIKLEIEAMVLNKDIGFVHAGQEAEIKIESFPFTRYGLIDGTVRHVSPDAIPDEDQGLVYATRVTMLEKRILVDNRWVELGPGMSVTVEVKTGDRRLLEFFLSPFLRYQDEALRER